MQSAAFAYTFLRESRPASKSHLLFRSKMLDALDIAKITSSAFDTVDVLDDTGQIVHFV